MCTFWKKLKKTPRYGTEVYLEKCQSRNGLLFISENVKVRPILTVGKLKPKTGLFRLPTSIAEPYGPKNETKSDFLLVSMFLVEKN